MEGPQPQTFVTGQGISRPYPKDVSPLSIGKVTHLVRFLGILGEITSHIKQISQDHNPKNMSNTQIMRNPFRIHETTKTSKQNKFLFTRSGYMLNAHLQRKSCTTRLNGHNISYKTRFNLI